MKALIYNGPCDVQVKEVPDAKIEKPTDVLVRVTTTNICGSDLHMYEGRTSMESGRILGHENMGEVIEVGKAVDPRWPLQIPPPLAGSNSPRQDRPIVGQSAAARSVFDASCLTNPVSRLAASFSR